MSIRDHRRDERSRIPEWKSIGPAQVTGAVSGILTCAGRIDAIDFSSNYDSAGNAAMYLALPGGGVWRSANFNSASPTWIPLTDHLPDIDDARRVGLNSVSTLAVDPNQPQNIYTSTRLVYSSTRPTALLKSADGGNRWALIGQNQFGSAGGIWRVLVDPLGTVYVAFDSGGFWKSNDGGNTWINLATSDLNGVEFHDAVYFIDLNGQIHIYAGVIDRQGTRSRSGIWWFTNGSWKQMQMTLNDMLWQPFDRNAINHITLSADPIAGVCASLSQVGDSVRKVGLLNVYKLIRGTWQPQWFSVPVGDEGWIDTQRGYVQGICIAPDGRIYAGGIGLAQFGMQGVIPVLRNFVPINSDANGNSIHVDVHTISFYDGKLYVGTDGGLFRFTPRPDRPGVDAWESLNTPSLTNFLSSGASAHLSESNIQFILVGNQDLGIARRSSGTEGWVYRGFSNEREKVRFDPDPSNFGQYAFSGDPNNGFYWSQDRGISFQGFGPQGVPAPDPPPPFSFHPRNSARIMIGWMTVFETPDRGANWNRKLQLDVCPTALSYIGDHAAYVGANGQLFQTLNDGTTWNNVFDFHSPIKSICGDSANPNAVYVATQSKVYRRLTPEAQWEELTGNLVLGINVMALDPNRDNKPGIDPQLFVGTGAGVFVAPRLDGANTTWTRFGSGLPDASVEDLEVSIGGLNQRLLTAATWGRGAWAVSFGGWIDNLGG